MQLSQFAFLKDAFEKKPLVVAVISAVAAALFAFGFLSQRESGLMKVVEPISVVLANRDISAGEMIDETKLNLTNIPRRFAEPNAIVEIERASGRVAAIPIKANSQITSSIARYPSDGFGLAGLIPSGRRAFSISMPQASAASSLIRPNDSVDVIATFDFGNESAVRRSTIEIVSNAQVLAVNQKMAGAPDVVLEERTKVGLFSSAQVSRTNGDAALVTLAVTKADAQKLAFAQESGAMALALRPAGEDEDSVREAPTTITTLVGSNEQLLLPRKGFREYRGK